MHTDSTTTTKLDYRASLNLPRTDVKNPDGLDINPAGIPQRANLAQRELQYIAFWDRERVYEASLATLTAKGAYILHDGPPYSNGDIHLGHALNKILKDIIVKYKSMQGYLAPYIPGWDNHGLPIETAVTKEFREKKEQPSPLALRARCREYAAEYVERQKEQFKRLGVRGDWEHPYLTMSSEFEAKIIEVFGELVKGGYVYRGVKPVYWCPTDRTALADAEIEYADKTDHSIYVRFGLRKDPNKLFAGADPARSYVAIWTTTPWTIPANVAVAVHPDYDYNLVVHEGGTYLLAASRVEAVMTASGFTGWRVVKSVKGSELGGLVFGHPLLERDSPVVFADYVTLEDGTGIVHTAPGHGREDFLTGQRNNLPVLSPVDASGRFTEEAGAAFAGQTIWDGNGAVIGALKSTGALLAEETIRHSYPHCWRCHNPVIFRATAQWFMNIDHNHHRERSLKAIDEVAWYPKESINRIRTMVAGRPDWCLSRQRAWGVGIPVFYCTHCQTELLTPETVEHVRKLVLEHSSDAWFEWSADRLLPAGYKCASCGSSSFEKESDIFDVWFDSGCTNRAVLESSRWKHLSWPSDAYLEGGDQHRGWFNSSLMLAVATRGRAPYREVLTNGWTLDEKGYKFSKSKGNGVEPQEVIRKFGADVLRLWVASSDYFEDLRVGPTVLDQCAEMYKRLRNTLRFTLGNLYDFDPASEAVAYSDLMEIDRYALHRLNSVVLEATGSFDKYEFQRVTQAVHQFCTVELSAFYLDVIKDRLYADGAGSHRRRSGQTVLYELTSTLARMLSPILSFTAEEVWQQLRIPDKPVSVELAAFPSYRVELADADLAADWHDILIFRDEVNKVIETERQAKNIGNPLEAMLSIEADSLLFRLLEPRLQELPSIFLVSQVELREGAAVAIRASVAPGEKCARCWLVKRDVYPASRLCGRCTKVVSGS